MLVRLKARWETRWEGTGGGRPERPAAARPDTILDGYAGAWLVVPIHMAKLLATALLAGALLLVLLRYGWLWFSERPIHS